jgi:hypothetical protein
MCAAKTVRALDINPPTPVLHRLVLGTVGRPLWEYTSELDLLTGFRAALQGESLLIISRSHLSLPFSSQGHYDRGVFHRDIPGNIMLTEAQNYLL